MKKRGLHIKIEELRVAKNPFKESLRSSEKDLPMMEKSNQIYMCEKSALPALEETRCKEKM